MLGSTRSKFSKKNSPGSPNGKSEFQANSRFRAVPNE
jgi:hypothetical protein